MDHAPCTRRGLLCCWKTHQSRRIVAREVRDEEARMAEKEGDGCTHIFRSSAGNSCARVHDPSVEKSCARMICMPLGGMDTYIFTVPVTSTSNPQLRQHVCATVRRTESPSAKEQGRTVGSYFITCTGLINISGKRKRLNVK